MESQILMVVPQVELNGLSSSSSFTQAARGTLIIFDLFLPHGSLITYRNLFCGTTKNLNLHIAKFHQCEQFIVTVFFLYMKYITLNGDVLMGLAFSKSIHSWRVIYTP